MRYDFDAPPPRRQSDSLKWRAYDEDVLPLWVADMDFVSPEPVIRALQERVAHGVFGYPAGITNEAGDLPDFRRLIIDRLIDRYEWRIQPEDMVFVPGAVVATDLACHALATPDGGVLIQPPIYPPILNAPQSARLNRQEAPLVRDAGGVYRVDWDAFEAAIAPQTRLFVLCNPHNPVGRVFQKDELEHMAEICLRRGVIICSDELHCELIYRGQRHTPIASLDPEIARKTITIIAPTKTFNLAGLQCSIVIIPDPELRQKYQEARQGLAGWINLMGLLAGEVAYREGQAWLDQALIYLEANRDHVCDFVQRDLPGVDIPRPEGTYLAWLDCRRLGIEGNPYEFFLQKARVALSDGAMFGRGGEGFVRLNFGCSRATLNEALTRMKQALSEM